VSTTDKEGDKISLFGTDFLVSVSSLVFLNNQQAFLVVLTRLVRKCCSQILADLCLEIIPSVAAVITAFGLLKADAPREDFETIQEIYFAPSRNHYLSQAYVNCQNSPPN